MKYKQATGAALALALSVSACAPAQAAFGAPQAGFWMSAASAVRQVRNAAEEQGTPGIAGSTLAFDDVERVVRKNNASIQSFDQTLEGVGETDVGDSFMDQYIQLEQQIAGYEKQIKDLDRSIRELQKNPEANAALIRTLQAQKASLEASLAAVRNSYEDLEDNEDDAEDDLEITYNSTERQLGNAADQIVIGAETAYISLHTLDNTAAELERNLAALDRNIATLKTQVSMGAATELDLLALRTQRQTLEANRQTLQTQRRSIKNNLAILCGYGTDETVEVSSLPEVSASQISAMDYEKDLAEALKNSYSIWQKEDALRQANDDYEDNVTTSLHAVEAAKIDLAAQKETVTSTFRQQFNAVKDKNTLYQTASAAAEQQAKNFAVSELQYQRGALSKNEYESAKDELAAAQQTASAAKIELFTAYNTYTWAKRGVMS